MDSAKFYNATIPAHVPYELIFDFDLYNPQNSQPLDYYEAWRQLQTGDYPHIFWTRHNGGHWVVTKGDYIKEGFTDWEAFSNKRMMIPAEINFDTLLPPVTDDPPEHTQYRLLIANMFSPRTIDKLDTSVREMAVSLIDNFIDKGECEFVHDFAMKLPILIFLRMANIPEEHRIRLISYVDNALRSDNPGAEIVKITAYLRPIIAERKKIPGDDLFSILTKSRIEDRELEAWELEGLCTNLLFGGLDTVTSTMGFFARFLADNPEQRKRLIADPKLIPKAVEELLRRYPVVATGPSRRVTKDTEFHGVLFKEEDRVSFPTCLYNFDDAIFRDPMTVNFDRPRPVHITFATGPHTCPGSYLARRELAIFIEEWLKRIPDFEIKPDAKITYKQGHNVGLEYVPLRWETS